MTQYADSSQITSRSQSDAARSVSTEIRFPRLAALQDAVCGQASSHGPLVQTQTCSQIVIPARLASTRLPEKLLLRETGKTVLQHTYEAAQAAQRPTGIIVAVDSLRLQSEVESFGGQAFLTDPDLPSGTDRVAAVARHLEEVDVFINVQGDEPEIAGQAIDLVAQLLEDNPTADVATLAAPIRQRERLDDPSCVKVVCDHQGRALYFSRSTIPHARSWDDALLSCDPPAFLQHMGIYGYRRDFLLQLSELPPSPLEQLERLEQLRFLQAGCHIVVGIVGQPTQGIDTWNDYRAFVRRRCAC
ncbi:MAG: 3-deoxy-manno-octulosonate cytidylyltransferase [Pirellulaceae bacterium]|nr:3-deoxy-manno-octulosonate cytidylyltransferase [Pirellulaceae bacterium]